MKMKSYWLEGCNPIALPPRAWRGPRDVAPYVSVLIVKDNQRDEQTSAMLVPYNLIGLPKGETEEEIARQAVIFWDEPQEGVLYRADKQSIEPVVVGALNPEDLHDKPLPIEPNPNGDVSSQAILALVQVCLLEDRP